MIVPFFSFSMLKFIFFYSINTEHPDDNEHTEPRMSYNRHQRARAFGGKGRLTQSPHTSYDSRGREYEHRGSWPVTLDVLRYWATVRDPEDLARCISDEIRRIEDFLSQDRVEEDLFSLLVSIVDRVLGARFQETAIRRVLELICRTEFLGKHLTAFVLSKITDHEWHGGKSFLEAMIRIFDYVLSVLPSHSLKIITAIPQLETVSGHCNLDGMVPRIRSITARASQNYRARKRQPQSRFGLTPSSEIPPDDFRQASVLPTNKDIREDEEIFLRPNVVDGGYQDKDHYLDVQFRLMKQDFLIPLRQGIIEFQKSGLKKHFDSTDLRMYYDVHILGMVTNEGVDHVLQFDVSKLKSVKWDLSKRLIFGALVCLSKDGFETIAIATISNRDPKDLKLGYVNINVKSGLDVIFNSTPDDEFVMAETVALYEAYCHVLKGLQNMSENLPFEEHIVSCEKRVQPAQYLLEGTSSQFYDLSPFMEDSRHVDVPILITTKWPSTDKMCLNDSQREAAQIALTKRLAIIQGPPGTGKTYVGLKVVQTILENQVPQKDNPILVVCYTNHALDQFLEGILDICEKGIIRVGGRSKSECLEPYNLRNIRKSRANQKRFSNRSLGIKRKECKEKLQELIERIEDTSEQMEHNKLGICSEAKLLSQNVMNNCYKESLRLGNPSGITFRRSALSYWLNIREENPGEEVAKIIESHMTKLILEGNFPLTHSDFSAQMPIGARATLYKKIVLTLRAQLQDKIKKLQRLAEFDVLGEKINRYIHMLELCGKDILPDQYIIPTLGIDKFGEIVHSLRGKESHFPDTVIKAWLLGLHRGLHEQLNDLEILQAQGFEPNPQRKQHMEVDDVKISESNFEEEAEFDEKYLIKTKALRNSLTAIVNRLEVLRIDDEEGSVKGHEGGWHSVSKPLSYTKMRKKIRGTRSMTETQEKNVKNVWQLDTDERFSLYKLWLERCRSLLSKEMESLVKQYELVLAEKREISAMETAAILKEARVIGMTTTGAAKHQSVLQTVGCRVIVVEEAAEVLEAHIVTALNKDCEHLILIGDHQQLRPNPAVYELAMNYGLEISLFERLVKNQFPHVVLQEQHRMRPEISNIMRHIYPDLQDHPVVSSYAHIQGVASDVFLMQHEESESGVRDTQSKANGFEASYVTKLCMYLLLQDYDASQITILATYTGQILAIKNCMKAFGCDPSVRVTSVDNFQGEENDIIILSLVRSNENNNIGFLKVDNRVCVALSRAKKGLFITGNFELLSSRSKLWSNVVSTAQSKGFIGKGLPVVCSNHPDEGEELMFRAEDFDRRPLGGCGKPCGSRLNCGHLCELTCHGYDKLHEKYLCKKPCTKSCESGHPCKKKCSQECGYCLVKILKKIPDCGHVSLQPCYLQPKDAVCPRQCGEILDACGHLCSGQCGNCKKNNYHALCEEIVQYTWPCGHKQKVKCHIKPTENPCPHPCETILHRCGHQCSGKCGICTRNLDHALCEKLVPVTWPCGHEEKIKCHQTSSELPCPHPCEAILDCGHKCKGTCGTCLEEKVHIACGEPCEKNLPCGHPCSNYCSVPCKPCERPCPRRCRHGSCGGSVRGQQVTCGHICIPCSKKCLRKCKCQECSNLCSEACSNPPCDKRCKRKLDCGHTCCGLCGELCVCGTCDKITTLKDRHETVNLKTDANKKTTDERARQFTDQNMFEECAADTSHEKNVEAPTDDNDESTESNNALQKSATHYPSITKSMCNTAENGTEDSDNQKPTQQNRPRLLKIPTCDHVFHVEELDHYVNNFEREGSSFIPCPECQMPIQRCTRYEHINLLREEKRSQLKKALLMESALQASDKESLARSKEKLESSSALLEGLKAFDPYDVRSKNEVLAMSLKFKLAFVLNEIKVLKSEVYGKSDFTHILSTRKDAVNRIGKHLTPQQRREFLIDSVRSLFRAVGIKVFDITGGKLGLATSPKVPMHAAEVLPDFFKLAEDNIKSFLSSYRKLLTSVFAKRQFGAISKHVGRAFRILCSDDDEVSIERLGSSCLNNLLIIFYRKRFIDSL